VAHDGFIRQITRPGCFLDEPVFYELHLANSPSCCGRIQAFCDRVAKVNAKHGPFDAAVCAGDFLGQDPAAAEPFFSGSKPMPIATYFMHGPGEAPEALKEHPNGKEICDKLHYLGEGGVKVCSAATHCRLCVQSSPNKK